MELKQIVIKGFKSFADKTIINFTDGITAIVGPNGSGKSNIIEAIRWVMGETSAKSLRGDRMADIIFSGTDQRKAVNIAEVTIVLDNADHFIDNNTEEVTLTRKLHRDGRSDYFINKQTVRLKDITDIFTDSGLGKESFSIVSQGQVESVFNSKTKDRRGIFEEAAGVLKFKERKKDAENELEKTKGNLNRIKDILYELEGQRDDLENESNKAKKYLDIKANLEKADIFVTTTDILHDNEAFASGKAEESSLQSANQKTKRQEEEIDRKLNQLKAEELSKRDQSEIVHNELLNVVQNIERAESDLKLSNEKSKQSEQEKARIQEEIKSFESKSISLNKKIATLEEKIKTEQKEYESIRSKQKKADKELSKLSGSKEDLLASIRSKYMNAIQNRTQLNNQQTYLDKENSKAKAQLERYEANRSDIKNSITTSKNELQEDTTALLKTEKVLNILLCDYKKKAESFEEMKEKKQALSKKYESINRHYHKSKQKYDTLLSMQNNYSSFYQGVQKVMQNQANLEGIVGTVAELIRVPEEYQTALDLALGGNSQHIIVEDDKSGRKAISFLKKNRAGRATFLPLTTIEPRYVRSDIQQQLFRMNGFVAIASELISYDKKIKAVIQNLLGNIIIAENLKSANAISRQINRRHRIVTLEGDVINVGGSMTGGSRRKSQSAHIFSQQNELEDLKISLPKLEKQLKASQEKFESLDNELNQSSVEIEQLRLKGEEKRNEEQQLKNMINSKELTLQENKKRLKATDFEYNEVKDTLEENALTLKENKQTHLQIEKELKNIQNEMDNTEEVFTNQEKVREEINETLKEIQEELSNKKVSILSLTREKDLYNEQLEEVKQSLTHVNGVLSNNEHEKPKEPIETIEARKEKLEQVKEKLLEEQNSLKNDLAEINETLNQFESSQKGLRIKRESIQNDLSKTSVKVSQLETSLSQALNYLNEEYAVSFEESKENLADDLDYLAEKENVKALKQNIKTMGSVNVQAIEDFKLLDERYNFMSSQRDDLLKARDDLFDTMEQMDTEVATRFEETFNKVQKAFSQVFPKMFGGGRAELILTDPDNMLETGIEIKAQPPGKNLQQLSLLSGGERALTAISLLFAIIHTRPMPFVILDEVEAALDDANVLRFGNYLNSFDNDTQFIVITHRKGTMESANTLYGVVMQEKGVSNIVSVRLSDVDDILEE